MQDIERELRYTSKKTEKKNSKRMKMISPAQNVKDDNEDRDVKGYEDEKSLLMREKMRSLKVNQH